MENKEEHPYIPALHYSEKETKCKNVSIREWYYDVATDKCIVYRTIDKNSTSTPSVLSMAVGKSWKQTKKKLKKIFRRFWGSSKRHEKNISSSEEFSELSDPLKIISSDTKYDAENCKLSDPLKIISSDTKYDVEACKLSDPLKITSSDIKYDAENCESETRKEKSWSTIVERSTQFNLKKSTTHETILLQEDENNSEVSVNDAKCTVDSMNCENKFIPNLSNQEFDFSSNREHKELQSLSTVSVMNSGTFDESENNSIQRINERLCRKELKDVINRPRMRSPNSITSKQSYISEAIYENVMSESSQYLQLEDKQSWIKETINLISVNHEWDAIQAIISYAGIISYSYPTFNNIITRLPQSVTVIGTKEKVKNLKKLLYSKETMYDSFASDVRKKLNEGNLTSSSIITESSFKSNQISSKDKSFSREKFSNHSLHSLSSKKFINDSVHSLSSKKFTNDSLHPGSSKKFTNDSLHPGSSKKFTNDSLHSVLIKKINNNSLHPVSSKKFTFDPGNSLSSKNGSTITTESDHPTSFMSCQSKQFNNICVLRKHNKETHNFLCDSTSYNNGQTGSELPLNSNENIKQTTHESDTSFQVVFDAEERQQTSQSHLIKEYEDRTDNIMDTFVTRNEMSSYQSQDSENSLNMTDVKKFQIENILNTKKLHLEKNSDNARCLLNLPEVKEEERNQEKLHQNFDIHFTDELSCQISKNINGLSFNFFKHNNEPNIYKENNLDENSVIAQMTVKNFQLFAQKILKFGQFSFNIGNI